MTHNSKTLARRVKRLVSFDRKLFNFFENINYITFEHCTAEKLLIKDKKKILFLFFEAYFNILLVTIIKIVRIIRCNPYEKEVYSSVPLVYFF